MSDLLNNLIETDIPEVGGYYRAGSDSVWDCGLTAGRLYIIEAVETEEDFYVTNDSGEHATWIAMDCVIVSEYGGKLYANPANKA